MPRAAKTAGHMIMNPKSLKPLELSALARVRKPAAAQ